MYKIAGIKPFSYKKEFLGELKQSLLLFDLVGVPYLESFLWPIERIHQKDCIHRTEVEEMRILQKDGHLFNAWNGTAAYLKKELDVKTFMEKFDHLLDIAEMSENDERAMAAETRMSCMVLNNALVEKDFISIPVINSFLLPQKRRATRTDIINIIVEQMPIPHPETPVKKILEFKSDPDNQGRFAGLRVWVNRAVKSGLSVTEIKDELEYLLYQYKKSLEIHKIKYHSGILQSLVVGTAEILENIATLKFSKIAQGWFLAQQTRADLMLAELSAPCNDLAYIFKAHEKFSRK